MDRRQQKTRTAIFEAFDRLLSRKRYEEITVQNILDEANIGRSTFYAHFPSKDALLEALCADIFDHVFSDDLAKERLHDYSHGDHSLAERIEHICRHLYENGAEISRILAYDSGDSFVRHLSDYLHILFAKALEDERQSGAADRASVPADFQVRVMTDSLISAIRWWVEEGMQTPPDQLAQAYMVILGIES